MLGKIARRGRALSVVMLCVAVIISFLPWSSGMNGYAFAGDTPETVEEAKAALDAAEGAKEKAEREKVAAENAYNDAKDAYDQAKAEADAAEKVAGEKEQAANNAVSALVTEKKQAYDTAEKTLKTAEAAYNEAKEKADKLRADMDNANTSKEEHETSIATLSTDIQSLKDSNVRKTEEKQSAEAEMESLNAKWMKDKADAAEKVKKAQTDYEDAGYQFINNKIDSLGSEFFTLEEMMDVCKGYTDAKFKESCTSNGKTVATIADAVNDASFKDILKSHCTYDNLMHAAKLIRKSNELRGKEGKSIFKVSYQLMGVAMMSNTFTAYSTGHTLYNKNGKTPQGYANTDSFWAIGPATTGNENLAYAYGYSMDQYDPYVGWYDEEKEALQKAVESGKWSGLSMDLSTREIWNNYPNLSSQTNAAGYGQVGHYLTLRNEEYTATGAAIAENEDAPDRWPMRATQSFNDDTKNAITVDQYENEVKAYFKSYQDALENAKAEQQALNDEPQALVDVKARISELENTITENNSAIESKQKTLKKEESELEEVNKTIADLKQPLADAEQDEKDRLDEKDTATRERDLAKAESEKANGIDLANASTYSDYDHIKELVSEWETAKETAEKKNAELTDKQSALTRAENDEEEKEKALLKAGIALQAAQNAYDAFFKLENAVIAPIPDQTYTGEAVEPALTIKDKGKTVTLKAGTDYTVSFKNNTNAGEAALTIEGKGIYSGSQQMTFQIQPKEITVDMVSDIPDQTYNSKAIEPQVTVAFNSSALTVGKDYNALFESNTNAGEATVTISGKGNYTGTATKTFTIAPKAINDKSIIVDPIPDQQLEEDKSSYEPTVNVKDGGATLTCEQDFKLAYENSTEEGTATVTISGQGNYSGTRQVQFQIVDPVKLKVKKQLEEKIGEMETLDLANYSAEDQKKIRQAISDAKEMLAKPASEISIDEFEGALSGLKTAKTNADTNLEKAKQQKLQPKKAAAPKKPAKVTLTKVKKGKGKLTVQWKRVAANTTGYQIQLKDKKSGQVKLISVKQAKGKKIKKVVKGLKHKTKYTVMVRACNQSGKLISWGPWSKAKTGKVK